MPLFRTYKCPYCGRVFGKLYEFQAYLMARFRAHIYGRKGKRPTKGCKEKTLNKDSTHADK